jgi:hypothetical protein
MKCDFEKLLLYVNKGLDWDAQLEVLDHLGHCEICCDAVCQIARDRMAELSTRYQLERKPVSLPKTGGCG